MRPKTEREPSSIAAPYSKAPGDNVQKKGQRKLVTASIYASMRIKQA